MSRILLVDWLGRGGIAQTTEACAIEFVNHDHEVVIVTRADRELGLATAGRVIAADGINPVVAHRAVARAAALAVHDLSPDIVIVQNYVLPILEAPLYRAVQNIGCTLVVDIHDHKPHSPMSGSRLGLAKFLRQADVIVAHSDFVAAGLQGLGKRREVSVMGLPLPLGLLRHQGAPSLIEPTGARLALHFGVLKRAYKRTDMLVDLARQQIDGWHFGFVGVGGPVPSQGISSVQRFVSAAELMGTVAASQVTLLPYNFATQSAAVVLAQALGSVPIATKVGGISEQIIDGSTGFLLPLDAGPQEWRQVLMELSDDDGRLAEMAIAGVQATAKLHDEFVTRMLQIVVSAA